MPLSPSVWRRVLCARSTPFSLSMLETNRASADLLGIFRLIDASPANQRSTISESSACTSGATHASSSSQDVPRFPSSSGMASSRANKLALGLRFAMFTPPCYSIMSSHISLRCGHTAATTDSSIRSTAASARSGDVAWIDSWTRVANNSFAGTGEWTVIVLRAQSQAPLVVSCWFCAIRSRTTRHRR